MQSQRAVPIMVALAATAAFAQWSEPVNITRLPPGRLAYLPSITADSAGNLHASWSLRVAYDFDWIDYATKPADSDTWLAPVHVSRDSYPYRGSSVVIGPGGVPHVLWQSEGQNGHLYISCKSGDTWSIPERCPGWSRWGFGLRASADRQHRIHAVWGDLDLHTIWYARYDDSGWQAPEAAVTATGEVAYPDVATDRAGYAHVVYQPPGTPVACGYVRQTAGGWLSPELIPALVRDAQDPRIALDTGDYPQVAWYEGGRTVYSGWTGGEWAQPIRLDSTEGYQPRICADSWGQVHIAFGDQVLGTREAACLRGQQRGATLVDTLPGWGELTVNTGRLHMMRVLASLNYHDIWYSARALAPPGLTSSLRTPLRAGLVVRGLPGFRVGLDLPTTADVRLTLRDVVGRRVWVRTCFSLSPGWQVLVLPAELVATGVYLCEASTAAATGIVKLVRE